MNVSEVDTPALLLDLDRVERNLDRMAALVAATPVKLRPHAKTHKTARIARLQLERGAIGICCAKLGEAEVLADGGIDGILITTEIVGAQKIARLIALAARAGVITVVDDAGAAAAISAAAVAAGLRIDTLVDVDVGQHRTGVTPGDAAVRLGQAVAALPGLRLRGIQGYEGHVQHVAAVSDRQAANAVAMSLLCATAAAFEAAGLATGIVTTGGTGTALFSAGFERITDVQPGSYVVMDAQYGDVQGVGFESALTVLAAVISVRDTWAIVDAGHKSLSSDAGAPRVPGVNAEFRIAGDEHGKLLFDGQPTVALGATVRILPSHCDTTINLHNEYVVHRSGTVVDRWPIDGRGRTT
ncbi:MAG TPA: alanine racemase [Candidatus Lustribacter sp.]|nr:alanine racemase [Candidatus Lustribacter sp.]